MSKWIDKYIDDYSLQNCNEMTPPADSESKTIQKFNVEENKNNSNREIDSSANYYILDENLKSALKTILEKRLNEQV